MQNLILYHPGARGDFISSILFGDRLAGISQNATVLVKSDPSAKTHWYKDSSVVNKPEDFAKFNVVRISASTWQEQKDIAYLVFAKHNYGDQKTNDWFAGICRSVAEWEDTFKDIPANITIPFAKLFDINYISTLCESVSSPLTDLEKQRIQENIDLNLALLNGPREVDVDESVLNYPAPVPPTV